MISLLVVYGIFCLFVIFGGTIFSILMWGNDGEFGIPFPRVTQDALTSFSEDFRKACKFVAHLEADRCHALVGSMTYNDRKILDSTLACLKAHSRENLQAHSHRLLGLPNKNFRFYRDQSLAVSQFQREARSACANTAGEGERSQPSQRTSEVVISFE